MMNIKQELYDAMNKEISELKTTVEKLTKERDDAIRNKDYYYREKNEATAVIEQMHLLLDAMEGSGNRETEPDRYGSTVTRPPMTRLAQWMASRIKG
jgi:hypothetical protein